MDNGWIKTYRRLRRWEWYTDSHMVHLFLHLLLSANHEGKEWRGTTIKRGQLVTGRKSLSKETGISEQSIRTCLERLKSTNEITIKSTNRFSIITICNYDQYQERSEAVNQLTSQPTPNNQPATNHKQELKNEKKKRNTSFDFFSELLKQGVDEKVANDWLLVRKKHRAENTETAFKGLANQIAKSGLSWDEAITLCAENSWRGFKAEWVNQEKTTPSSTINHMRVI